MDENHSVEDDIIFLGFAARFLLTNLDREVIVDRALESLANFGLSDKIGLFLYDQEENLYCAGGTVHGERTRCSSPISTGEEPWEHIIADKKQGYFSLDYREGVPIPVIEGGVSGRKCFCAPLVAGNNWVIGVATFEYTADFSLSAVMTQSLMLLLTIIAVALEAAHLLQEAVYDGLTGLYIRRYFDLRLGEEENRVKRYGGRLAILIMDVDHFKDINDRFGHQEGDNVLREIAGIVKSSVRQELDSPCRYGGEEFVVIMPDTDLDGAQILAERIRHSIENHVFQLPGGPVRVTLSGGLAFMDQQGFIPRLELLRRADSALYLAKGNGRNQIQVWQ